ncbi:hypothetical protein OAK88_02995, partial [Akkermansiaceae bacterium]|nr:hypothetical protein [Akkermansiaceae bacterium]
SYEMATFTHRYGGGYGGPEIDQTTPIVESVTLAEDGMSATLKLNQLLKGHVHEFDLAGLKSRDGEALLHKNAYYTVNEVPAGIER